MYIPPHFKVDDFQKLSAFIQQYNFATVITSSDGTPFASHLPLMWESRPEPYGTLIGHMARANPQWKGFSEDSEALMIFHGPHAYISPSWYEAQPSVPTWNYAAVHAYGVPRLNHEDERLEALLYAMIEKHESGFEQPWTPDLPADYMSKMMKAIVGFEIPISRIEGKFKLGQNRSDNDQQSVYGALLNSPFSQDREMAEFIKEERLAEGSD